MINILILLLLLLVAIIYGKIVFFESRPEFSCFVFFDFCTFYFATSYYVLGGTTYGVFDNDILLASAILALISASNIYLLTFIKFPKIFVRKRYLSSSIYNLIVIILILILVTWIAYNSKNLILLQVIQGSDLTRLDIVATGVRGYYTYYSIVMFLLTYFFFKKFSSTKYESLHLFYLVIISLFAVVGGNKAVIVYFICLILIFHLKSRPLKIGILLPIVGIITGCFALYYLLKGYADIPLQDVIWSAIRRLFVTQGAGMLNRWAELDASEYIWGAKIDSYLEITNQIYFKVYGHFGSMPAHAWGDFILDYGFIMGTCLCLSIYWIYIYLIYQLRVNKRADLIIILLMSFFVIQQGGINSNQIQRIVFSIFVLILMSMFRNGGSKVENQDSFDRVR